MTSVHLQRILMDALTIALVSLACGMLAMWVWTVYKSLRRESPLVIQPIVRLRPAHWGLWTLFWMIVLYVAASFVAVNLVVQEAPPQAAVAQAPPGEERPEKQEETESAENVVEEIAAGEAVPAPTEVTAGSMMLINALYNGLFLLAFPAVFRHTCSGDAEDLGVTRERWPEQLQIGILGGLLAAPLIYLIQTLSMQIWKVSAHPVQKMLEEQFDFASAGLAVVSAVILAPIVEEVLFRGLLQGWLTRVYRDTVSGLGSGRLESKSKTFADTPTEIDPNSFEDFGPSPFTEKTLPLDLPPLPEASSMERAELELVQAEAGGVCWPAVVVTSVLFAAVHAPQWPAPIALFVFSLILGWVYQRTGTLLTAIVMHGLFNACSTLMLIATQLAHSLGLDAGVGKAAEPAPASQMLGDVLLRFLS